MAVETSGSHHIASLQEAWSKRLPVSKAAEEFGEKPAKIAKTGNNLKRGKSLPADLPAPIEEWGQAMARRPFHQSGRSLPTSAPSMTVRVESEAAHARLEAESSCGPETMLCCLDYGIGLRQDTSPHRSAIPQRRTSPADGNGACTPAQVDDPGASGWMYWAGWVAEGCEGWRGGCWCCRDTGFSAGLHGRQGGGAGGGGEGGQADRGGGDWVTGAAPPGEERNRRRARSDEPAESPRWAEVWGR
jgi:hypothetical protein